MKPVLFLDIDGVLNSEVWYRRRTPTGEWREEQEFDPDAVFLLKAVVCLSDCEIVISSSWRRGRELSDFHRLLPGLPIIAMTPVLKDCTRGQEVLAWLREHKDVTRFVIIDDSIDFFPWQPRVKTDWKVGLTPHCARTLVAKLASLPRTDASRN